MDKLTLARHSYQEVLDATKHQDEKVGRFLTGMAFLVAGALAFTAPETLARKYEMGELEVAMPAVLLGLFMFSIVLSALFYLLATSAPLTLPPRVRKQDKESHLFFGIIALDSAAEWSRRWEGPEAQLEKAITAEYIRETLNLARRADGKAHTSLLASALFVIALLFFLLTIELAVHVQMTGRRSQELLEWSFLLRGTIVLVLIAFAGSLLYQRLWRIQRDIQGYVTRRRGFHLIFGASAFFIAAALLPVEPQLPIMIGSIALLTLSAALGAMGYKEVLWPKPPNQGDKDRSAYRNELKLLVGAATALLILVSVFLLLNVPLGQFLIAVMVALNPLLGTPLGTITRERRKRSQALRENQDDNHAGARE